MDLVEDHEPLILYLDLQEVIATILACILIVALTIVLEVELLDVVVGAIGATTFPLFVMLVQDGVDIDAIVPLGSVILPLLSRLDDLQLPLKVILGVVLKTQARGSLLFLLGGEKLLLAPGVLDLL